MNKIIVCYQINKNSQSFDYNKLHEAIAACGTCASWMRSMFILKSQYGTETVYKHIRQFMDSDDYLRCDLISSSRIGTIDQQAVKVLVS